MKIEQFSYDGSGKFSLKKIDTTPVKEYRDQKEKFQEVVTSNVGEFQKFQQKLISQKTYSILIVIQGMDASGKDSMVRNVLSGVNPSGFHVTSFKALTENELNHDYLWRVHNRFPAGGEVAVFNRYHYEEVLIDKVHPENIVKENIPGISTVNDVTADFWKRRYKDIVEFENFASRSGILMLKFFLHMSKDEQRKRFLRRIEIPSKNWKFAKADITERKYFEQYQKAYEDAIQATSTKTNPWYIIPSDDKWFSRVVVSDIIKQRVKELPVEFPKLTKDQEFELQEGAELLNQDKY